MRPHTTAHIVSLALCGRPGQKRMSSTGNALTRAADLIVVGCMKSLAAPWPEDLPRDILEAMRTTRSLGPKWLRTIDCASAAYRFKGQLCMLVLLCTVRVGVRWSGWVEEGGCWWYWCWWCWG